ncbi:TRAM domain-containing protein [Halovenus salina]|uniref:TRAM domain-containing protein n=1 Tax=Halovenus salina TaxID=1510225 RepID=A0ABD5W2X3_9EURY|nr:TRAM domain-containing protein [Halovenus salina]
MHISNDLLCLYSATITEEDDTYTIEVPKREVERGNIQRGEIYRVALLSSIADAPPATGEPSPGESAEPTSARQHGERTHDLPVSEGETREVEIEGLGDQGDGIAKVERGYVLIVPETDIGDRVTVRLQQVQENVGFAEVIERHHDVSTQ